MEEEAAKATSTLILGAMGEPEPEEFAVRGNITDTFIRAVYKVFQDSSYEGVFVADKPSALSRSQLMNKFTVLRGHQGWFRGTIAQVGRGGHVTVNCRNPTNPSEPLGFPQHLSLELYNDLTTPGAWVLFERA